MYTSATEPMPGHDDHSTATGVTAVSASRCWTSHVILTFASAPGDTLRAVRCQAACKSGYPSRFHPPGAHTPMSGV
jgi:hypothetical protein